MKILLQRVNHAVLRINNEVYSQINKGFLAFVGITDTDTDGICDKMLSKMVRLRIFDDENGKTNLSLDDVQGQLVFVSQFTLYADCKKGNRPSFIKASEPEYAQKLYNYCVAKLKEQIEDLATGEFGADMKIEFENDGPFTIMIDSDEII